MSGIRRRAIYERVVRDNKHLVKKVEGAADILRPIFEADPKVREWFECPGSGGAPIEVDKLKAPLHPKAVL